jgi:hypothetical protein
MVSATLRGRSDLGFVALPASNATLQRISRHRYKSLVILALPLLANCDLVSPYRGGDGQVDVGQADGMNPIDAPEDSTQPADGQSESIPDQAELPDQGRDDALSDSSLFEDAGASDAFSQDQSSPCTTCTEATALECRLSCNFGAVRCLAGEPPLCWYFADAWISCAPSVYPGSTDDCSMCQNAAAADCHP